MTSETPRRISSTVDLRLRFRASDAGHAVRRLRAFLKHAGRVWGFKCVSLTPVDETGESITRQLGQLDQHDF